MQTAELAEIFQSLERIARELASTSDRLRAVARQPPIPISAEQLRTPPTDLISAAEAGKLARRSKQTIARWCAAHPWEVPGGFAVFIRKRWHVSKSAFAEFLSQSPSA